MKNGVRKTSGELVQDPRRPKLVILRKKVAEYGLKKWKEIATFLPGRIGKQCRERWYNNVDPNLNKEKWTIAEDL